MYEKSHASGEVIRRIEHLGVFVRECVREMLDAVDLIRCGWPRRRTHWTSARAAVAISVSHQSKKSYLGIALAPCADQQQNAQGRRPRTRATESGPTLVLIHSTWHPLLMSSSHAEVKTTTVIKGKTALRWTRTRTSARKVKVTSRPRCR